MKDSIYELQTFVTDAYGRTVVSDEMSNELKSIVSQIDELQEEESYIRKQILDGMIKFNIDKCQTNDFTFTQVMPKAKETFDTDAFVLNESEDIIRCFSTTEETLVFDENAFKNENPELYEKYCKKEVVINVDTKKLQKSLAPIYEKYVYREESDKLSTLRITPKKS